VYVSNLFNIVQVIDYFFFQLYIYMIDLISFDKAVLLITLSDT